MPRVNLHFAFLLAVSIAVAGVAVYFLHRFQTRRHADFFLDLAHTARDEGKPRDAVGHYYSYFSLAPRDNAAMAEFGLLLADLGANREAFQALEQVLRTDPDRTDVRRRTVEVAMGLGRFRDAREHLEQHLLKAVPDDGELLDLHGQCQARAGEYVAAARSFESAIERAPTRIGTYARLASILSECREDLAKDAKDAAYWKDKTADYWLDRMVGANPLKAQAYLVRGRYRWSKAKFDDAILDAVKALELKPDDPAALGLAARSCLAAKQHDRAKEYALRGIKVSPKDGEMYARLADIELAGGQADKAMDWLRQGAQAADQPELLWRLGRLFIVTGRFGEAEAAVESLRKRNFQEVYVTFLEAQIAYVQGQWQRASQRFGALRPQVKSFPELAKEAFYCEGRSWEQLGDAERALAAYREAVKADAWWIPAREAVAKALESLGRLDEALEEQRTLAKLKDAPLATRVQLIRWSILANLRLAPSQRNWSDVENQLDELAKATPTSISVPVLRAELLVAQNRPADAEKLLQAARDQQPNEIVFWIALVDLAIRQKQWDRAQQTLEEAEKKLGDHVPLRLARAYYLAQKGEADAAEQLGGLAENTKDFSREDLLKLWRGLVPASMLVNDLDEAARLCQLLMAQEPSDLQVRLQLFDVAAMAHNSPLVEKALGEIQRLEGSGPLWHYAMAVRLGLLATDKQDGKVQDAVLQQALEHLAEARRLRPGWSRPLMLEGWIHEDLRQENAALAKYTEAVERGENSPELIRRALRLLYRKGRYSDANALVRRLEEQQVPFTVDLFRMKSGILGQLQDFQGALKPAEEVAAASEDFRDHIWLGQLLGILGRRDEAEKALRHAISLADQAPETWVALVQFLVRTDQKGRAEEALAEARAKIPAAQAPLALAECLELLGHIDEAGEQYAAAASLAPDDLAVMRRLVPYHLRKGNLHEAEIQLRKVVDGRLPAPPELVAGARRDLAVRVLAAQGGYPNLLEAIRLVEQNLAGDPTSADDLHVKARLLSAHPLRKERQAAVSILEKLVEDPRTAEPEDRFLLARLYQSAGDWPKARRHLVTLLARHGDQPRYVAAYVEGLLEHKEVREAENWVERLETIAPDDPRTVQLRAAVLFHSGRVDETVALLEKSIEKSPADSPERLAKLLAAAAQLDALGSRPANPASASAAAAAKDKAEILYRQYVKQRPEQGLILVEFLARQKRLDEALQLAEEAWKAAEPPTIAVSCEMLLRQPGITAAQVDRLAAIVSAALKKHQRATPLLLVVGQVRTQQEKYQEAEAIYRELLQRDAQFVPALNNLAELLALGGRQLDEARTLIEKAVTLDGPNSILLDTRAMVYLALGQTDKALSDLREVVAQGPSPLNYFHLALAQRKAGQPTQAADSLKKAETMQIRAETLHPLERPAYAELVRSLP